MKSSKCLLRTINWGNPVKEQEKIIAKLEELFDKTKFKFLGYYVPTATTMVAAIKTATRLLIFVDFRKNDRTDPIEVQC